MAKYLIYTGKFINARDAKRAGLADAVLEQDELFEILSGNMTIPASKTAGNLPDEKWQGIGDFFESNTISQILGECVSPGNLSEEEDKLCKVIKRKAPLALKISEKLIDEEKGCDSELEHLNYIFSTSDALLGLGSIGKKVEFTGK